MKSIVTAVVLCALLAPASAVAQQSAPAPVTTPTPTPNQFNDPAMSFTAPLDYSMAPVVPHDPTDFDKPTVVAAYIKDAGKDVQRIIILQMESFSGSVADFEPVAEQEVRGQSDSTFVTKKVSTTLPNGMPAFWEKISAGTGFEEYTRYQWVWCDGRRGITLSIMARFGTMTEDDAKRALGNVSAVAYPMNR